MCIHFFREYIYVNYYFHSYEYCSQVVYFIIIECDLFNIFYHTFNKNRNFHKIFTKYKSDP